MKNFAEFPVISCLVLLYGCVHKPPVVPFELTAEKVIPQNEAIVFGKVEVLDFKKKPINWGDAKTVYMGIGGYAKFFVIYIVEEKTTKKFNYVLREDGSFYWHLPPGIYIFQGYHYQTGQTSFKFDFLSGKPKFTVSESDSLIYVGTLVTRLGLVELSFEDEYEEAIVKFRNNFPKIIAEPIKKLWSK